MLMAALGASGPAATGTTWFVDDNTCPSPGTGSPGSPFCEIQSAICAAMSGDMVSVAEGVYPESIRMKPGVSVSSSGSAAGTTINGFGQQCTESDFCTKRLTTTQCSTVIFASGHTPATVLEGFTITGGEGFVDVLNTAGGGIYIFSSPTIRDNIITDNVLMGPTDDLDGAGIYVAVGQPIITNNTISFNKASPPGGGGASSSSGYGGGIFVGFFSAPTIVGNLIANNQAGDPNAGNSVGTGGGINVFPGEGPAGPVIDRNIIQDNFTISRGGGIALRNRLGSAAIAIVTNNVIDGNETGPSGMGGGIYTYLNNSLVRNNTIRDNTSFHGGGIFSGESISGNDAYMIDHSNNIIVENKLKQFGAGGGILVLDLDPNWEPTIRHNDLFDNQGAEIAGGRTEADTIGFDGNFSADPLLVDPNNGDWGLAAGSPAVDVAMAAVAPPVDLDGMARGVDGDGMIDSPETGDVDIGALESYVACQALPESCDGIDNNCNASVDEGFTDTDGDMLADCVDDDDDDDTVLDPSDCAPLDDTAFGLPSAVVIQDVTGTSPQIDYEVQNIGSGTYYEVVSGFLSRIQDTGGFHEDFCIDPSTGGGTYIDSRPPPPPGEGWYYMFLTVNACGRGTLGTPLRDQPGAGDVCPLGVVDEDFDGSASDLDCDDGNALRSHLLSEVCDALDNDCDGVPDDLGQTSCGIGACHVTTDVCIGGVPQTCTPGTPAPSDGTCDGIDDDCNNQVDEDWVCPFSPLSGKSGAAFLSCTTMCGVGECAGNQGTLNCQGGMEVDSCDPLAGAQPEVCDGLDNDCNAVTDDGFLDTDGDQMADCVDPDDDNDGSADGSDCAPLDNSAFGVPFEVTDVQVETGSPTPITFMEQTIGSGTLYHVGTGQITTVGTVPFMSGACLMTTPSSPATDGGGPAPGAVRYYLVKSSNACGPGTYGTAARDTLPPCP